MSLNAAAVDFGELGVLLDRWHTVGLVLRRGTSTAALWLDGRPVLDGVPLVQGAWAGPSPDILVRSTGTKAVRVEDLEARYRDSVLRPVTAGRRRLADACQGLIRGLSNGVFPRRGRLACPGMQPRDCQGRSRRHFGVEQDGIGK